VTVLIVEDDENKRLQLRQFLGELLPSAEFVMKRSLQSSVRSIRESVPELIILDMTLPNYDTTPEEPGGQMYKTGGREFLRQMDRFEINTPVIVVTQFEKFGETHDSMDLPALDSLLRREHSDVYKGFVYYNAAISDWKQELEALVRSVLSLS